MNHDPAFRILAMDVRRNRFGYVLFEGPEHLLDWGASSVSPALKGRSALKAARRRIGPLLRRCHPMLAVVKRTRRTKTGRSSTPGPILKTVLHEAAVFHVPVRFVSLQKILDAFREFHCRNKDDIAEILAKFFPELAARLPPRRGKWGTERPRMAIFDALAAGFTYWHSDDVQIPPPE